MNAPIHLSANWVAAIGDAAGDGLPRGPQRSRRTRDRLAEHGYTPLDYFRARYWIRHGRPPGYRWDLWG